MHASNPGTLTVKAMVIPAIMIRWEVHRLEVGQRRPAQHQYRPVRGLLALHRQCHVAELTALDDGPIAGFPSPVKFDSLASKIFRPSCN